MEKFVILFALAIAAIEVQALSIRYKRQTATPAQNNCTGNNCTPRLLTIDECIGACSVTSEYNPICGTNNVLYSNPGRLLCARDCGVDVQMGRPGRCPEPVTVPASVPAAPTVSTDSAPAPPSAIPNSISSSQ